MTNEERDLISRFIARVSGQPQGGAGGGGFTSSVPATQPSLPPVDPEADRFIADNFNQYPEARYRITQTAVVQEAALAEAQNRIKRLEWELQQTQAQAQQAIQAAQQQGGGQRSGGLFGGLFGGGGQQRQAPNQGFGQGQGYGQGAPGGAPNYAGMPPPPQPTYPPGYQPGMFQQRGGSGFLGSALTTAAGVAGGMVVGNALMDMFSGHEGGMGGGGFGGMGGGETIVNNNYGDAATGAGGDPFGGQGTDVDPNFGNDGFDGGGFDSGGGGGGGGWDDDSSSF
ncbi:DUF2076 domain-containing protein [Lichenicoccus roseus]|uniref:DUF2076 domain-containing protein n=1 Tax=Lichenicoccus roseus TaxID=2683649 RepID=A0A5R9J9A9_9PROT|nr:DUF2076 domain-containing protein [Lichenicoccus roseus]TLU73393.1 DUF2076 domain-containing protein [Lichenicoccus roseus]